MTDKQTVKFKRKFGNYLVEMVIVSVDEEDYEDPLDVLFVPPISNKTVDFLVDIMRGKISALSQLTLLDTIIKESNDWGFKFGDKPMMSKRRLRELLDRVENIVKRLEVINQKREK